MCIRDRDTPNGEAGAPAPTQQQQRPRGAPRKPRAPGAAPVKRTPVGVPSKTLLFAGNLSRFTTNATLMDFFSAYPAKSATVKISKLGERRSRGFAFVDFPSEEQQQRALQEMNGKELNQRPISLKVAIQPEQKENPSAADGEPNSAAAPEAGGEAAPAPSAEQEAPKTNAAPAAPTEGAEPAPAAQ